MQEIERLLGRHGLRPDALLDQCFMADRVFIDKIVSLEPIRATDVVLEIGAGLGTLTKPLAERAGKIIAVELDRRLEPVLRENLGGIKNVELLFANALDFLQSPKCVFDVLISNTPYSISEPLIKALPRKKFRAAVLTLPEDFVKKLLASQHKEGYTPLSFFFQHFFDGERAFGIPRTVFFPQPNTENCVLRLWPRKEKPAEKALRAFLLLDRMKADNSMREALIETGSAKTKNEARAIIAKTGIDKSLLEKRVKDLTVDELKVFMAAMKC